MEAFKRQLSGRPQRGFTLVEMLIVIVVISLLVAVAYPSYLNIVVRNNRSVARAALVDLAARQEAYFSQTKTYASTLNALGFDGATVYLRNNSGLVPPPSGGGVPSGAIYQLGVASTSATSFTVEAVPQNIQTNDSDCGKLMLDAQGVRSSEHGGADCW